MRFLIVFATALACASAAPSHSHLLPYAGYSAIPAISIHALPKISSGDIQAAAIDAHVKASDFAQEYVDKARLVSEQVAENLNTQVITAVDQNKERLADAFWANEDKKWQALDALKTAEAQIDGAIASKADAWANTAVVAPYGAYGAAVAPVATATSVGSVLYGAPALKSYSTQTIINSLSEASKAEAESLKVEAAAKAAVLAKEAEAEKFAEAVASNAAAELKSKAEALAALKSPVIAPVAVAGAYPYSGLSAWSSAAAPVWSSGIAPAWSSGVASALSSGVASAWSSGIASGYASAIAPTVALANPGLKYASTVQHIGPLATSTLLKTPC